jgi:transmembrane sensor
MQVAFDDARRSIRLLNGEALFEIAKDRARPFFVETAGIVVRVVGTTFTVRSTGEPVKVVVHEGLVQLSERDVPESRVLLRPNQKSVATGLKLEAELISDEEGNKDLAWREGNVAFNGETLAEAAVEFARYSEKRIEFADREASDHKIIGLYKASDPAGFANAIALSFDLEVIDRGPTIVLATKAQA